MDKFYTYQQQQQQRRANTTTSGTPTPALAPASNQNFKVVIRIRPPLPRELQGQKPFQNIVHVDGVGKALTVSETGFGSSTGGGEEQNPDAEAEQVYAGSAHRFTFDHVYDQNCSQRVVYDTTAKGVVESALMGYKYVHALHSLTLADTTNTC